MVRALASRARTAASDKALDIGTTWNLLDECADTLDAMNATAVKRNRVIRGLRRRCEYRLHLCQNLAEEGLVNAIQGKLFKRANARLDRQEEAR
jgi:hypothetical protein